MAASRYVDNGRVKAILVGGPSGDRLTDDVIASLTKAGLSLSASQTSQLVLAVEDHMLELTAGGFLPKRTPIAYGGLRLEVAVREIIQIGGVPGLQITCRAAVVQAMKRTKGARAWSSMSYSQWAAQAVHAAGGTLVAEPSARQRQVVRKAEKGQPPESDWDVLQRGAQELGFVAFESEGVVYFARPTWLAAHRPKVHLYWAGDGRTGTSSGLLSVPTVRDSDDDNNAGYTGSLNVSADLAETLVPGRSAVLHGLGPYDATYLAADVSFDLGSPTATVAIATPVNPEPAPPDTSADDPADGKAKAAARTTSAGTPLPRAPKPAPPRLPGQAGHSQDKDFLAPDRLEPIPTGQRSTGGAPPPKPARLPDGRPIPD